MNSQWLRLQFGDSYGDGSAQWRRFRQRLRRRLPRLQAAAATTAAIVPGDGGGCRIGMGDSALLGRRQVPGHGEYCAQRPRRDRLIFQTVMVQTKRRVDLRIWHENPKVIANCSQGRLSSGSKSRSLGGKKIHTRRQTRHATAVTNGRRPSIRPAGVNRCLTRTKTARRHRSQPQPRRLRNGGR